MSGPGNNITCSGWRSKDIIEFIVQIYKLLQKVSIHKRIFYLIPQIKFPAIKKIISDPEILNVAFFVKILEIN